MSEEPWGDRAHIRSHAIVGVERVQAVDVLRIRVGSPYVFGKNIDRSLDGRHHIRLEGRS
jgi:hypothetical protein